MRRVDELVAAAETLVAHPVFHHFADDAALGVPEDKARAGEVLNAEEIELLAQHAMVAARRFFEAREVLVEFFFREEGRAVDALELRILFVAQPVGAREVCHLEGLDAAGGGDVRAAAEVDELAVAIEAHLFAGRGELRDEVGLHEVAIPRKFFEGLLARLVLTDERLVAGDDLGHFFLDGVEILRREGFFPVKVVEETRIGGGAVAELGLREELEDGRGEDVCGRVADHFESFRIVLLHKFKACVGRERCGEIDQARSAGVLSGVHRRFRLAFVRLAVVGGTLAGGRCDRSDAGDHARRGKARGDGVRDFKWRRAGRNFADRPVRQMDGDRFRTHVLIEPGMAAR